MPQISEIEFLRLPLRVHQFLAAVPLHDVWAVDLPGLRTGITLDQFLRAANQQPRTEPAAWVGTITRRLREDSTLKISDLAGEVGRHPAWVGSAYRHATGEGLQEKEKSADC